MSGSFECTLKHYGTNEICHLPGARPLSRRRTPIRISFTCRRRLLSAGNAMSQTQPGMDQHGNVTDETGTSIYNLQIYSQKGGIAFPRNAGGKLRPWKQGIWMAFGRSRLMKWPRSSGLRYEYQRRDRHHSCDTRACWGSEKAHRGRSI